MSCGQYNIAWRFYVNLNEGAFFTNAGLMATSNNDSGYSHRILDAYGFKVIRAKSISTAHIDFNLACSIGRVFN